MICYESPDNYSVVDCRNKEYLNGRSLSLSKTDAFFFTTLLSCKQAIDRYQEKNPNDPIFHGRWNDSPEIIALESDESTPKVQSQELSPADQSYYDKYIKDQIPGVGWLKSQRDTNNELALKELVRISKWIQTYKDDKEFNLWNIFGLVEDLRKSVNLISEATTMNYCIRKIEESHQEHLANHSD
jgi:hypothetical protein